MRLTSRAVRSGPRSPSSSRSMWNGPLARPTLVRTRSLNAIARRGCSGWSSSWSRKVYCVLTRPPPHRWLPRVGRMPQRTSRRTPCSAWRTLPHRTGPRASTRPVPAPSPPPPPSWLALPRTCARSFPHPLLSLDDMVPLHVRVPPVPLALRLHDGVLVDLREVAAAVSLAAVPRVAALRTAGVGATARAALRRVVEQGRRPIGHAVVVGMVDVRLREVRVRVRGTSLVGAPLVTVSGTGDVRRAACRDVRVDGVRSLHVEAEVVRMAAAAVLLPRVVSRVNVGMRAPLAVMVLVLVARMRAVLIGALVLYKRTAVSIVCRPFDLVGPRALPVTAPEVGDVELPTAPAVSVSDGSEQFGVDRRGVRVPVAVQPSRRDVRERARPLVDD